MKHFKHIFVILVYKNTKVLHDFFDNFKLKDSHVIVVNSYYDEQSLNDCESIAKSNSASFINIENKGYSYGNNIGIKYALSNYTFDFLIVSNSDIVIKQWKNLDNYCNQNCIIAPQINILTNKNQNPNIPYFSKIAYYNLLRKGYRHNNKIWIRLAQLFSRISREFYLCFNKFKTQKKEAKRIFSAHGAFIIFTYKSICTLNPVFNDRMFLYNEELYLAFRCKLMNIDIFFDDEIKILHLEGASSSSVSKNENKKSFLILDEFVQQNNL